MLSQKSKSAPNSPKISLIDFTGQFNLSSKRAVFYRCLSSTNWQDGSDRVRRDWSAEKNPGAGEMEYGEGRAAAQEDIQSG